MLNKGPNVPKKEGTERWLYELLRKQGLNSQQAAASIAALGRGEAPDGSGLPLPTLDDYLYKPGRPGGQKAFGGINAAEILIFSSTRSSTKGAIWLTEDGDIIIDEDNKRVGIGETDPDAKLHIKIGAQSTIYIPSSDISTYSGGTFGDPGQDKWGTNSDPSGLPSPYSTGYQNISTSDDYSSYWTADNSVAVTRTATVGLNGTLPTGQATWTITLRAASLFSSSGSGTLNVSVADSGGNWYQASLACTTLTGSWANYTLTATDAGSTGHTPNSLTIGFSSPGSGGGGNPVTYNVITYVTVGTINASDILQKWESPSADNELTYETDGNGDVVLILDGDKFEIQSDFAISSGAPAAGYIASSTDSIGSVTWIDPATLFVVRTAVNSYAESTSVSGSSETIVLTYVAAADMFVQGMTCSASAECHFRLKIAGTTKLVGRSSTAERTVTINLGDGGIAVTSGQTITITAYHEAIASQTVEVSLAGYVES